MGRDPIGNPMTAVVLLAVGAFMIYNTWSWIRWVVAHRRYLQERNSFEHGVRLLLDGASQEVAFRLPSADEDDLAARLESADSDIKAFVACGFTAIGDIVAGGSRDTLSLVRVWLDDAGTTQVQAHVSRLAPSGWILALLSVTGETELVTMRRDTQTEIALPPWSRRELVAADLPVHQIVARHRAFVRDESARLVRFTNLEHVMEVARRNEARLVSWRATLGWLGKAWERPRRRWRTGTSGKPADAEIIVERLLVGCSTPSARCGCCA